MSLLSRIGVRAGGGLTRTRIGAAVVIHADKSVTDDARALANSMPADPDYDLVVSDLPSASPVEVWESFVAALPRGRGPLRVVPGRRPRDVAPQVWQWLAERTDRAVLAACGTVHHGAGLLFVHSVDSSGWWLFRKGTAPTWMGKRFPRPAWDSPGMGRVRAVGSRWVVEPLPAGVWLRPDVAESVLNPKRAKLIPTLPCLPDAPVIVLGTPGVGKIELSDIVAFWRTLPRETAAAVRFVRFGDVALPRGATFGQALADVLGAEVCCYTGIPVGSPDAPDVLALRPDGSLGWRTFAQVLSFRKGGGGAARPCVHRQPVAGLAEVAPGIYPLAPDVVLEVVQAGLWIRWADNVADPAGVRTAPLNPVRPQLFYEATDPRRAGRLREWAQGLVGSLDDATGQATRILPSTALSRTPLPKRQVGRSTTRVVPAPLRAEPTRSAVSVSSPASQRAEQGVRSRSAVLSPPAEPALPQPQEPEAATPDEQPPDTDLPLLSRLMETRSIAVAAIPSTVE